MVSKFRDEREAEEFRNVSKGPIPLSKSLQRMLNRYLKLRDKYPFEKR